jgi:hypothetical protein
LFGAKQFFFQLCASLQNFKLLTFHLVLKLGNFVARGFDFFR